MGRVGPVSGAAGLVVFLIVLAVGNLMVAVHETFESIGGSQTWNCADCGAALIHEPTHLAAPVRLVRETDDEPRPHRWVFDECRPVRLTLWDPFHWLAIFRKGYALHGSERARADLDTRADGLIRECGLRSPVRSTGSQGTHGPMMGPG